MRLLNPRGTDLPHAGLRSCVGPKRLAIVTASICERRKIRSLMERIANKGKRWRANAARDAAIKARAVAKAKAPPKPVFESAPPVQSEQRRSSYVGPGSKWHRRMVESGRKG